MNKNEQAELVATLDALYEEHFGDVDASIERRNVDMYRNLGYAEGIAADFAENDFSQVAALDLALDDAADLWDGRLESETEAALLVVADEWERAALSLEPGDREAAWLRLAVRLLRDAIPRLDRTGVEEEIRARSYRDDLLNVVAEARQRKDEGEPAFRRFLKERGDHARMTIAMAGMDRPRPADGLLFDPDDDE